MHQRILRELEERILSGELRPGDRIASEHDLAEQYGCSRMTINKAITQLAKAGYVDRRRRAGTFVRRPQATSAVLEVHTVESEVAALGLPYRYELIDSQRRHATREERERLELSSGSDVLAVTCLHHASNRPFCLEERLINPAAVGDAPDIDVERVSPGAWLLAHVPWRMAEHAIVAMAATDEIAERLEIASGDACLRIERRTWNADAVVTEVRLTYPADRHRLVARFTPSHDI
jgi:GntR family histidine utilization transcriptional repressor